MKAFHFRLDQALRWRTTQLDLEKSRVSAAARRLASIREAIEATRVAVNQGAAELRAGADGLSLSAWGAYSDRSARRVRDLEKHAKEAEQSLAAQMQALLAASRGMKLLENLKNTEQRRWQSEFNRDLDAFAGESHLLRLQSKERKGA